MPTPCPTPEALQRMLDDSYGPGGDDVETHVAECKACQDVLERLTESATSVAETFWTGAGCQPASPGSPTRIRIEGPSDPRWDAPPEELPHVPGYAMDRELGRGGMGVVYLARQANADRLVAIKMIAGGRGHAEDVMRFRLEGENLARLRHPNIVQVYEVGAIGDRPFFSMEYVSGGSLAASFAEGRRTPLEAAALVETLARAVYAAHQCGVIHRDLKPANILLDVAELGPSPMVPKITDFGLAKRVGDDSGLTQTGQILGTPSYMAPEQASGGWTVGVPADVYALGAILYEALTGRPPFQGASPWETMMKVVHDPAPSPSRVRPDVPRDLEVICSKCLSKKPEDRYPSAYSLAEDLERWREGRPIAARPAGTARRAWLWARRHPAYAVLGSLLAASVVAGVAGVAVQWARAERHLDESRRSLVQSRRRLDLAMSAIESFYTGASGDVLLKHEEFKDLRSSLLSTPLRYYQSLRDELEADGEPDRATLSQLVEVLTRLGGLNADVGREDDAFQAYRQAAEAGRRILRDDPHDRSVRRALANALIKASEIDARTSRLDRARVGLEEAFDLFDGLVREDPANPDLQDGRASCLHFLGDVECDEQHYERSESFYLEAVDVRKRLHALSPQDPDYLNHLGGTENNLAILYAQWNRLDDAGRWFREGLEMRRKLAREHVDDPQYRRKLASSLNNVGSFALNTGRAADAPAYFKEALTIQEGLVHDHPTVALYQDDLAVTHENIAPLEADAGRSDAARSAYARALEIRDRLAAEHPASLDFQVRLVLAHSALAVSNLQEREYGRAEEEALAAAAVADRASAIHSGSGEFRRVRAEALRCLGDVMAETGRSAPAEAAYSDALALLGEPGREVSSAEARQERARVLLHRGVARSDVGRHLAAEADFRAALTASDSLLGEQPGLSTYRLLAADARIRLSDSTLRRARHEGDRARVSTALEEFTRTALEMASLLQDEPNDGLVKAVLTQARAGRSTALEEAGRFEEALSSWDEALADAPRRERLVLERGRAATLCRAGRIDQGVAIGRSVAGTTPETAAEIVALARLYALAATAEGRERYAAEAVDRLGQAAAAPDRGDGYALLMRLGDRDFEPLSGRPGFRALLQDMSLPADVFAP